MIRRSSITLIVFILILLSCSQAFGIIVVPKHPNSRHITLSQQLVDVDIKNGVSRVGIKQTFHNNEGRVLEGTYLFPIPEGASISDFTMFVGGEEVKGEILDKDQAARKYHEIVRRMQDPGLLEYVGKGLFQARVYPIPAHGDVKIKLFYQQVLPYDNGVVTYRFTSEDPKFYKAPIKDYRLSVNVRSESEIKAVYSPTHQVQIERSNDRSAHVLLSRSVQSATKDFILYYSVSKDEIGCNLLTYFDPYDGQGYFLGLIAPDLEEHEGMRSSKNVMFVIDVSGSMAGEKIEQAREALKFCLNSLHSDDKFGIISYADYTERYSDRMQHANRENVRAATRFVDRLQAGGGTDINRALLEALAIQGERSFADYIIFLTDGEPTVGEQNPGRIVGNINGANEIGWKIFCFGVGDDVKAGLLDDLASESGAMASYVRPGEDIEVKVSNFFAKISNPAMTDVRLVCSDNRLSHVYPRQLPDLFYGMQLVVAGKYDSPGNSVITLEGFVQGKKRVIEYNVDFTDRSADDNLVPRQWAIRRIGFLLDEISKNRSNPELKDEIVRLSKEYGIVTPYTSFFIEDPALAHRDRDIGDIIAMDAVPAPVAMPEASDKEGSISRSQFSKRLSGDAFDQSLPSETATAGGSGYVPQTELEEKVASQVGSHKLSQLVTIADRTFQSMGDVLVDSRFDGTQEVIKIKPFSEAYFKLLELKPEIGKYLSNGGEMIVVIGDIAISISEDGKDTLTDEMLKLIG